MPRYGVVLFQRTLAPYRISLFNELARELGGGLTVILTLREPPRRRQWEIPWQETSFHCVVLEGRRVDVGRRTVELSRPVSPTLARLAPEALILGGWDVPACWGALAWARRREIPMHAWVESSAMTGRWRGTTSTSVRRAFLSGCETALVPGAAAERFVQTLQPGLPCLRVPNSIASPELRALDAPPSAGSALFLGELSTRKGAHLLLQAAPTLLTAFPSIVVLGDGPLRGDFEAAARALPGFVYKGFLQAPARAACMAAASVVLLPSERDPWPLAACEALVARRPLVVGRGVGSTLDLVELAGDAVVEMRTQDAAALVEAALAARTRSVPERLRHEFTPQASAAAIAFAVKSSARPRDGAAA